MPGTGQQVRPAVSDLIAQRVRPLVLAREDLLPVAPGFAELLGTPGLRRGSTLAVAADGACGTTAVALGLIAEASSMGAWCAAVELEDLGIVAADELGVSLDRLVLVPRTGKRFPTVVAALLDGCDIVLVAAPGLSPADRRRLSDRARERRAVLVVLSGSLAAPTVTSGPWPDGVDVLLSVTGSSFAGLGAGNGRMLAHRVDVIATRRAAAPQEKRASLWLPSLPEGISPASPVGAKAAPASAGVW